MERTRIKICGIKSADMARAAVDAGADAIGLNFVPSSPRYIPLATALEIVPAIASFVAPVGLFSDPTIEEMLLFEDTGINTIQLHGDEDLDFIESIPQHRVVKAVPQDAAAIDAWRQASPQVTGLLIDAPRQGGGLTGGTGRTVDWHALAGVDRTGLPPLILAGGLTPENVGEAIRVVRPYAVDVSSGVESSRGVKDAGLIRAFCDAVREADRA